MADSKTNYSSSSREYVSNISNTSKNAAIGYEKSKSREQRYNDNWLQNKANINDVVEKFAPNSKGVVKGVKYIFYGPKHNVIADMASGYVRIWDKNQRSFVKLDGKSGNSKQTHFKIMKKEEMK